MRIARRVLARRPLWFSYVVAAAPELLAVAVLAVAFGTLAEDVLDEEAVVDVDRDLAQALHRRASPAETELWTAVSDIGGLVGMAVAAMVAAAFLWRSSRVAAAFVTFNYVAAAVAVAALKLGFGRPRPVFVDPLATEGTPSFPSGHATVSTALIGAFCFLAGRKSTRLWQRLVIIVAGALVVAAIAFSRLYLGVHYLSDVVAGWLAGGAVLALAAGTLAALEHRKRAPFPHG